MAGTIIRIKHSDSNNAPANNALTKSELAYSFASHNLFVGETVGSDIVARAVGVYPAGATAATPVDADLFTFYDDSDNRIKKVTGTNLKTYLNSETQALTSLTDVTIASASSAQILVHDGSGDFKNVSVSGDIAIATNGAATIQANSVALGTDTTGNYVGTVTAGEGIASTGATSGEGIAHTVSLKNSSNLTDTYVPRWDDGNTQLTNGSIFDDGAGTITIKSSDSPETATIRTNGDLILDPAPFDSPYTDSSPEAAGNVYVTGNLIVNGSTTTVNSNVVEIGDSILTLNSDEAGTPSQDAGIEVERGSAANKTLIWDESEDEWSIGSEKFKAGTFEGALTGAVTGNADSATVGTNVTATANNSANETTFPTFVDGATGTQGIETDTGFTYNPSTGTLTSTIFAGRATNINGGASNQLVYQTAANTTGFVATTDNADGSPADNLSGKVLVQLSTGAPAYSSVLDGGTF
tara:strand:- start:732 stop:2135 length:1404 start_codon:yes stop_codon:yes gene_type:complete